MQVPKDLNKRMTALAEGIPRNVVGMLLKKLLPPEPVKVRRPEGGWKLDAATGVVSDKLTTPPSKRAFKGRRNAITRVMYKATWKSAYMNHRIGTWTYAMVFSVCYAYSEQDEEYCSSALADEYLRKNFPRFADRKIDWNWLINDVSYVEVEK